MKISSCTSCCWVSTTLANARSTLMDLQREILAMSVAYLQTLASSKSFRGVGGSSTHTCSKKTFLNVLGLEDLDTNVGCLRGHGRVSACVAIGPGFDPRSIQMCFSLTSAVISQMVLSCSLTWHKNRIYRILVRVVAFRKKDLGCIPAIYYCFFSFRV